MLPRACLTPNTESPTAARLLRLPTSEPSAPREAVAHRAKPTRFGRVAESSRTGLTIVIVGDGPTRQASFRGWQSIKQLARAATLLRNATRQAPRSARPLA